MARTNSRHREHRPTALGPRVFARGRWFACDLRPWSGGKPTLRNPLAPGWPEKGERLEAIPANEELAHRWAWAYCDRVRDGQRAELTGKKARRPLRLVDHESKRETGAVPDYIAAREKDFSPNTVHADRTALEILMREVGAGTDAYRVTTDKLQAIVDTMRGRGYKPTTLNTTRICWMAFFRWLKTEPNPAAAVVVPEIPQHELHAFSDAEVERLRQAADAIDATRKHPRARLMLELGLATGARAGEMRALRWEDFDPDSETVRIHLQQSGAGGVERRPKSKKGRTALVLEPWWRDWYQPDARGRVLQQDGKPVSSAHITELMQRITDRAGVDGTPHDLRRTYGRRFLLAGGTLDGLKHALGHASIRTTEKQYAAVRDEDVMQRERARMAGGLRVLP